MNISDICRDLASVEFGKLDSDSPQPASWHTPELGFLKLNFDGNCVQECALAGYGGVIRDHTGEFGLLLLALSPIAQLLKLNYMPL